MSAREPIPVTHAYRLPWPPSVNRMWRALARGKSVLSREGRDYFKTAVNSLPYGRITRLDGRLVVWLRLCAPTGRSYDIDNRVKAVLDVLTHGGVWHDDSQVDELHVSREAPDGAGRVEVFIQEI
jgi:crossover junction endodeoxyribonuclease RusA